MPNEPVDDDPDPAIDNQSEKDQQAATLAKRRRRLSVWAAGASTPFIVGLVLLLTGKGFDIWVSPNPNRPVPVTPSPTSSTSAALVSPPLTTTFLDNSISPDTAPPPVTTSRTTATRSTPAQQPPAQRVDPTLLTSGHATIINVDGYDLDNGQKADQNTPGMDVSPDSVVTLINAMSHGTPRMAVLPRANPADYARCQQIIPDAYVQQLKDIRLMHVGDHICVHTNLGNCGVMTLTRIPSDADQNLDFDYRTWDTFCRRS